MDIKIYAKNLDLNAETEEYIHKRFSRLERHLKSISDAKLEISRTAAREQPDRIIAQLTLKTGGAILRGQEAGLNLFAAIDAVTDVMDRQIRRYKGKVYRSSKAKKAARIQDALVEAQLPALDEDEEDDEEFLTDFGKVVRTKRFPMKPMTVDDAVSEMELLSHDFFLFRNMDSNEYNVVYRRHDGDYGIIEPELS
ncbi:MAG: ribosome-associated translation inhibitor RaiA [Chloroflexi bacterium]|nr:ribosome-associated translation inhibitor RaiA [Chloroflexota bacterium]